MVKFTLLTASLILASSALGTTINVPADQPTIQVGINSAVNGDEIIVAQGKYFENINFNGKAITVRSTNPTDPAIVATTIIDGGAAGSVVSFGACEGSDSILDGLTITNGSGTDFFGTLRGGGIWMTGAGGPCQPSPTIRNCTITGNSADTGGGIFLFGTVTAATPSIVNCTIEGNTATGIGGGIYAQGWPTMSGCALTGNTALTGAGVYSDGNLSISGSLIADNVASDLGGGLYVSDAQIFSCEITNNVASNSGGGLYVSDAQIFSCEITNNVASNNGGGLRIGSGLVNNCIINSNTAGGVGGGLWLEDEFSFNTLNIQSSVFSLNEATNGGGLYLTNTDEVTFSDTDVCNNSLIQISIAGLNNVCPQLVGACCLPGGDCIIASEAHCVAADGSYQGDGTTCAEAQCAPACAVDLDGDGSVGASDLALLLGAWGSCV